MIWQVFSQYIRAVQGEQFLLPKFFTRIFSSRPNHSYSDTGRSFKQGADDQYIGAKWVLKRAETNRLIHELIRWRLTDSSGFDKCSLQAIGFLRGLHNDIQLHILRIA